MVKLRFRRMGRKKLPVFSLVATDSRSPRDGRYIEDLGRFYPVSATDELSLNRERILYWLQQGAQPSDSVRNMLRKEGVMLELHLIRKGVESEEIKSQVEAHRTRWAEKAAATQMESPEERRKKALEKERKAAAEERKRLEKERQEREAELERQRKEAEEAERAAAAEEMKGEKEKEDVAEEKATEAEVTQSTEVLADETAEESPEADEPAVSAKQDEETPAEAEVEAVEEPAAAADELKEATEEGDEAEEDVEAAAQPEAEERRTAPRAQESGERIESEEAAEEEPEPVAETAPEPDEEAKPDKLTDVWGVGPKYASILNDAGIQTFSALAEKSVDDLQKIITDAGSTTAGNEETWAEQASFLAKGDKKGHDALVEKLKAG